MEGFSLLLIIFGFYRNAHGADKFVCPPGTASYPHPVSSSRFYRCVDGKATLHTCNKGVFAPDKGICVQKQDTADRETKKALGNFASALSSVNTFLDGIKKTETIKLKASYSVSPRHHSEKSEHQIKSTKSFPSPHPLTSTSTADLLATARITPPTPRKPKPTAGDTGDDTSDGTFSSSTSTVSTNSFTGRNDIIDLKVRRVHIFGTGKAQSRIPARDGYELGPRGGSPVSEDSPGVQKEGEFRCPDESGFFRHPTNCTRFYWCVGYQPSVMFCSDGGHFDLHTRVCSPRSSNDHGSCQGEPSPAAGNAGSGDDVVTKPGPSRGTSRSKSGEGEGRSGRHARQVTNDLRSNGSRDNVGLGGTPRFQCPDDGFYADPQNCSVFYHCFNDKAYRHQCQPGTAFNKDHLVCSWPLEPDGCGGMISVAYRRQLDPQSLPRPPGTALPAFQCPDDVDGFYPDLDDCTVFYRCVAGRHFQYQCGQGTAFNAETGVCSWPVEVSTGCGSVLDDAGSLDRSSSWPSQSVDDFEKYFKQSKGRESLTQNRGRVPSAKDGTNDDDFTRPEQDLFRGDLDAEVDRRPAAKGPVVAKAEKESGKGKGAEKDHKKGSNHQHHQTETTAKPLVVPAPPKPVQDSKKNVLKSGDEIGRPSHQAPDSSRPKKQVSPFRPRTAKPDMSRSSMRISRIPPTEHKNHRQERVRTTEHSQRSEAWPWQQTKARQGKEKQAFPTRQQAVGDSLPKRAEGLKQSPFTPWSVDTRLSSLKKTSAKNQSPVDTLSEGKNVLGMTNSEKATKGEERVPTKEARTVKLNVETYRVTNAGVDFRCPSPTGHFRNPENCAVYYHCADNVAFRQDCPPATLYDVVQHACLPIAQVKDCELVVEEKNDAKEPTKPQKGGRDFRCPDSNGYYRDPVSCSTFYRCVDGAAVVHMCAPNFFFDQQLARCLWAELVSDCDASGYPLTTDSRDLTDISFKCPLPNGHFRDPRNCSLFYHCQYNVPYRATCSRHQAFDVDTLTCVPRGQVPGCDKGGSVEKAKQDAKKRTTEKEGKRLLLDEKGNHLTNDIRGFSDGAGKTIRTPEIQCPESQGLFRDPEDCRIFYHCFYGNPFRHECQFGTVFSVERSLCTWPSLVPECQQDGSEGQNGKSHGVSISEEIGGRTSKSQPQAYKGSQRQLREDDSNDVIGDDINRENNVTEAGYYNRLDDHSAPAQRGPEDSNFILRALFSSGRDESERSPYFCSPGIFDQYLRDPVDCAVFHRCVMGLHYTFSCAKGTFFDPVHTVCDFEEKVLDCGKDGRRLSSPGKSQGVFGNVPGLHVPVPAQTAFGAGRVRGESSTQLAPGVSREHLCPKSDGLFPHPLSCWEFVYCSRNIPTVLTCPAGLLYNVDSMTCDFKENVICLPYDK